MSYPHPDVPDAKQVDSVRIGRVRMRQSTRPTHALLARDWDCMGAKVIVLVKIGHCTMRHIPLNFVLLKILSYAVFLSF